MTTDFTFLSHTKKLVASLVFLSTICVANAQSVEIGYDQNDVASVVHAFGAGVDSTLNDGVLEMSMTNVADMGDIYTLTYDQAVDITADPNIFARIKSDSAVKDLGVRLVDVAGNAT